MSVEKHGSLTGARSRPTPPRGLGRVFGILSVLATSVVCGVGEGGWPGTLAGGVAVAFHDVVGVVGKAIPGSPVSSPSPHPRRPATARTPALRGLSVHGGRSISHPPCRLGSGVTTNPAPEHWPLATSRRRAPARTLRRCRARSSRRRVRPCTTRRTPRSRRRFGCACSWRRSGSSA